MHEIVIYSIDHDTAKKHAVVTWIRKDEDCSQFLVVPLKDWNRQVEFESRRNPAMHGSNNLDQCDRHRCIFAAALFFLMQLDVIPMDPSYLSPVDNTPVPQYE